MRQYVKVQLETKHIRSREGKDRRSTWRTAHVSHRPDFLAMAENSAGSPQTRMAAADMVKKRGIADRCLYNSVYKGVTDMELAKLKESGIKMSIVLADNPKDNSLDGKMKVLEEALAMADKGGITKPLIDTAIPAFAPDMGTAVRTIPVMKEKYGHPVGLGGGNVIINM